MWNNNTSVQSSEGGYMDTSTTANTSVSSSYNASNRGQTCVPVMIAQLIRHGDNLKIWDTPVRIATFVAIVEKLEAVSTKVTFQFRDETGIIGGIQWINAEVNYVPPVDVNSYARVYGNMRNQNNQNYVHIVNIQAMEHINELFTHLMEVTLISMEGEKAANQAPLIVSNSSFANTTQPAITSTLSGQDEEDFPAGLSREQGLIFKIVKLQDDTEGAERSYIKSQVNPSLRIQVDAILEFLSAEGHVYTTVTDDHFKVIA